MFLYKQLPLNENDNNFEGEPNDINYKKTVIKLHEDNWNFFFTSDDVSMLSYGCGVSQYPQLYYRYLDKYQVLPRTYWGSFEGFPVEKSTKEKWMLDLVGQSKKICIGMY